MYQYYLSSIASQWLQRYVNLTLSEIDALIRITIDSESDVSRSRFWGWGSRMIGMVIAAEIFDASRPPLFCSLIMVMQNKMLCTLVAMDDLVYNTNDNKMGLDR